MRIPIVVNSTPRKKMYAHYGAHLLCYSAYRRRDWDHVEQAGGGTYTSLRQIGSSFQEFPKSSSWRRR